MQAVVTTCCALMSSGLLESMGLTDTNDFIFPTLTECNDFKNESAQRSSKVS